MMFTTGKKMNARKYAMIGWEQHGVSLSSIRLCSRIDGNKNVEQRRALRRLFRDVSQQLSGQEGARQ